MARDEQPVPSLESEAWARVRAEPDPIQRLKMTVHNARQAWESGMVDFESMVFEAAPSDPRLQELARTALAAKRRDSAGIAAFVFTDDVRRPDVALDDIVDLVVAIDSAATVRTLVRDLGWSYDKYERWLFDLLRRSFMT